MLVALCPVPPLHHDLTSCCQAPPSPCNPCEVRHKGASQDVAHNAGGTGCPLWAFFFPLGKAQALGALLVRHRINLGKELWSQSVAALLYPLLYSFFVSVIQGLLSLTPLF